MGESGSETGLFRTERTLSSGAHSDKIDLLRREVMFARVRESPYDLHVAAVSEAGPAAPQTLRQSVIVMFSTAQRPRAAAGVSGAVCRHYAGPQ